MACVLGTMLASRDLAVSYSVSTGNEAASGVEDFLGLSADRTAYGGHRSHRGAIPPARHLLSLARRARQIGKRLVLLHPGRSNAARESAATHTGALAGDYALMRAKVAAEGIDTVESLEELGDVLEIALRTPGLRRTGTAVMTESGAFKALTLDLCEQVGLALPVLDDTNAPSLRAAMPPFVPVSNPLDLTAQGLVDPDIYRRTLVALAGDERVGAIVVDIIQTDAATCERKFPAVLAGLRELKSAPLVVCAGVDEGAPLPARYIEELRALGVPYFPSPDRAVRAIARLAAVPPAAGLEPVEPVEPVAKPGSALPTGVIPEYRAKAYLRPRGIAVPAGTFVRTLEEAVQAATSVGYPVALKAQSAALSHKSDAGGVVLGLRDRDSLSSGWHKLHADLARHLPDLTLDGVLVEQMARPGLELIIGGRNDPEWGAVVLAGVGGVQAELLGDVRLLLPGQSLESIIQALRGLKCGALLDGFRGSPPLDLTAVAELIDRVGRVLCNEPAIREIDLNPVMAYPAGQGVMALDALMVVQPSAS